MANHPNRSKANPSAARNPTPDEIKTARERAGLTQKAAADLVYTPVRTWEGWEAGKSPMHPASFELFVAKTTGELGQRLVLSTADQRGSYHAADEAEDGVVYLVVPETGRVADFEIATEVRQEAADAVRTHREKGKKAELWRASRVDP